MAKATAVAAQKDHASAGRRLPDWPRGLRLTDAATYVGVSPSTFLTLVKERRMPEAKLARGCKVWDRDALDRAFDLLPGGADASAANPWDELP